MQAECLLGSCTKLTAAFAGLADDTAARVVLRFVSAPPNACIAAEAANAVLNICYERDNVARVLRCDGVAPLIRLLSQPDGDVQANAAGAIQSICFQVPCI